MWLWMGEAGPAARLLGGRLDGPWSQGHWPAVPVQGRWLPEARRTGFFFLSDRARLRGRAFPRLALKSAGSPAHTLPSWDYRPRGSEASRRPQRDEYGQSV